MSGRESPDARRSVPAPSGAALAVAEQTARGTTHKWRGKVWDVAAPLLLIGVIIALWEIIVRLTNIPEYLLPPPSTIAPVVFDEREMLFENFKVTISEVLGGFSVALGVAIVLGSALAYSRLFRRTVMPVLVASKAVPTIAVAPLLLIWFGYTYTSRVLITALICFFPITLNIADGLLSVDAKCKALFRSLGAPWYKRFRLLDVRSALPHAFTGVKIAVPLCVIGATISEWTGAQSGLGYSILVDVGQLYIPRMFASIALLASIGVFLYLCILLIEFVTMPWKRRSFARRPR